jgi:hypothetical protein
VKREITPAEIALRWRWCEWWWSSWRHGKKERGGEREVFEISPFVWFFGKKKKLKSF